MCNAINDLNPDNDLKLKSAYDIYFKDKTFHLPKYKKERPIKETELLKIKDKETGKIEKIEHNEYSTCKECGGPLVTLDRHRGERICECGMTNKRIILLSDTELDWQGSKDALRTSKDSLTHDEKKVIKHIQKHDRKEGFKTGARIEAEKQKKLLGPKYKHKKVQVKTSQKDLNKKRYILTVGTVASQLLMTKGQRKRVIEIIERYPLNMIHNRLNQQAIIAGTCRYILKQDGRASELRYNRSAFQFVGLTEASYSIIERNLKGLGL